MYQVEIEDSYARTARDAMGLEIVFIDNYYNDSKTLEKDPNSNTTGVYLLSSD